MKSDNTLDRHDDSSEESIDLLEIIKKLWYHRKFILKITIALAILGVLVAIFSSKEYTATCTIIPQINEKSSSGNLGGLAAMAGVNLGGSAQGDILSPKIYSKIMTSIPFQKELMKTPVKFNNYEQEVTLFDYYTKDEYKKFSLTGTILKYTIGLPGLIKGNKIKDESPVLSSSEGIEFLSNDENNCAKILKTRIALNLNDKEGYLTLSASMPEPVAAAQLAAATQLLLQKYITAFKIQKAQANLEFIEERYTDAKQEFELKQRELASFQDANRNFASNIARINEEKITNEFNVLYGVYAELAKQREQANIKVKENTPVFTVIEPITIPKEPTKPNRKLIVIIFTFLGGVIAVGFVLILPFIAKLTNWKRIENWKE